MTELAWVTVAAGERHMMGFEPLINQRLLPPTFPRYTAIRSREDTVEYFVGLVQRLSQFAGIVPLSDNLHALIVSLNFYCNSPTAAVSVVTSIMLSVQWFWMAFCVGCVIGDPA